MNLQLGSDTKARIQQRIKTGRFATPTDVVLAGLQLLEQQEKSRSAEIDHVRELIFTGLQELDRGDGLDGEQVFKDLLAELDDK